MKYYLRVLGWLLLGLGTVLGTLGLFAFLGILTVLFDFFGVELNTSTQLIYWIVGWSLSAAIGLALLLYTRRFAPQEKTL